MRPTDFTGWHSHVLGPAFWNVAATFWAKLHAEGATAKLLVALGERALSRFELSHELLAMLSKLGLSLSVDVGDAAEAAA